jgi:signal transduction histidine kinase
MQHNDLGPESGPYRSWPWLVVVITAVVAMPFSIWFYVLAGVPLVSHDSGLQPDLVFITSYALVGWYVVRRAPGNRIGPLLIIVAVLDAGAALCGGYSVFSAVRHQATLVATVPVYKASGVLYTAAFVGLTVLLPLWFPTGRVSHRWLRPVGWAAGVCVTLFALAMAFGTGQVSSDGNIANGGPLGSVAASMFRIANDLEQILPWLALASLFIRYRSSPARVRGQLRWFSMPAVAIGFDAFEQVHSVPSWLDGVRIIPWTAIAIAIAVARHQLFDTSLVVRRSALYGGTVAVILVAYVAAIEAVALLLGLHGAGAALAALAVLTIATLPVRDRARSSAERWVYGGRRDAAGALREVGERWRAAPKSDLLGSLCRTVVDGARVAGASIELTTGTRVQVGVTGPSAERFDLLLGGEPIGVLSVVAVDRRLGRVERDVIDALLPVLAVAAGAVDRESDAQSARERLVTAREEERRRLRRDLHDGLGPSLAGITMEIQAARALMVDDPTRADAMLDAAESWSRAAIQEIRRVVYGLRPPALDQFGLIRAIEQHASSLETATKVRLRTTAIQELPAAAEVAAYHIILEALTNMARHASARTCSITLDSSPRAMHLEVVDDGIGLAPHTLRGVGLTAMHERATELGGRCVVGSLATGGTKVEAWIPLVRTT